MSWAARADEAYSNPSPFIPLPIIKLGRSQGLALSASARPCQFLDTDFRQYGDLTVLPQPFSRTKTVTIL